MIRAATPDDMPALLTMGAAFHAEADLTTHVASFDPETFVDLCWGLARHGVLLVDQRGGEVVGMIGCGFMPVWFNRAARLAQEVFLYVRPDFRTGAGARLLLRLIDECKAKGATALFVSSIESASDTAGSMYQRLGFVPTERAYTKVL